MNDFWFCLAIIEKLSEIHNLEIWHIFSKADGTGILVFTWVDNYTSLFENQGLMLKLEKHQWLESFIYLLQSSLVSHSGLLVSKYVVVLLTTQLSFSSLVDPNRVESFTIEDLIKFLLKFVKLKFTFVLRSIF